ncbi:MAG TPA: response regulator transcription factor [Ktedonosporobacter sp.]|jgi:DNA-binding response OmpR family regulator|nr:response regulator transcription factor [Ktedonosporobacter sp.]
MRLLLIEDDYQLNQSLKAQLMKEGYAVDVAFDGETGEDLARLTPYDVIIIDVMIPKKDGILVCRALRRAKLTTPILLLTARDTIQDRVSGLDSGADDYLIKPFSLHELFARLRALVRRASPGAQKMGQLCVGDLLLDPATREVERCGQHITLNTKEFALLEYFMHHPNQVLTREMIEKHIWSYDSLCTSNVVDVYIRRLRRKIDDPFPTKLLETVHGVGYKLR